MISCSVIFVFPTNWRCVRTGAMCEVMCLGAESHLNVLHGPIDPLVRNLTCIWEPYAYGYMRHWAYHLHA
jgi:hypothetical protein